MLNDPSRRTVATSQLDKLEPQPYEQLPPKKKWESKAIVGAFGTAVSILVAVQAVAAQVDWAFVEDGLQVRDIPFFLTAAFYFVKEVGHRTAKRPVE